MVSYIVQNSPENMSRVRTSIQVHMLIMVFSHVTLTKNLSHLDLFAGVSRMQMSFCMRLRHPVQPPFHTQSPAHRT